MKKLWLTAWLAFFVGNASAQPASQEGDLEHATDAMGRHSHGMGPHMRLTGLRAVTTGDHERAQQIVAAAKAAIEKYKDPKVAEADNFKMFMPKLKNQKQYHFTNYGYAMEAAFRFNPEHPTSLLYEKDKKTGKLRLIGVMYTAPARFDEDQLHERIPLSISQWHQHVNLCVPPKAQRAEMFRPNARFGLMGSIASKEECEQAGGTFRPRVFGWMVHMYPYEKTAEAIWSVARQKNLFAPAHQH